MAASFRYAPKPTRVLFGGGSLGELPKELAGLGCKRALVISTAGQKRLADMAASLLRGSTGGIFSGAAMHTPADVTGKALAALLDARADAIVAIGGGSTIGLGKALALRTDLPQVAVPTTYAGSEMTDILGETRDGAKVTQRSPKILPETVIYDPDLTFGLPQQVTATSGMNAIAHAIEALYAADTNPVTGLLAEEGIRLLSRSLPDLMPTPHDAGLRSVALEGAWLCGMCLANAAMALHHKICHVLGGSFGLPHAETHTAMLPYTAAYNAGAAPQAMQAVARALDANDAVTGLHALKRKLVGGMTLKTLGLAEGDIDRAAEIACANPYPNPRPIAFEAIRAMIAAAHAGDVPAA